MSKQKERMNHCRQIATILAEHFPDKCSKINCNDVNQYLYNEIRDFTSPLKYTKGKLLLDLLNDNKDGIYIVAGMDGFIRYQNSLKSRIIVNNKSEDNNEPEYEHKRIKVPKQRWEPKSKEQQELDIGFWFLDKIGSPERALKVLNTAITARETLKE